MLQQDGSPAREYHEATKLRPGESAQRRLIDVDLIPRQYKRYLNRPSTRLPSPGDPDGPLTLASLSALLHYSSGIVRRRRVDGREVAFRAAACTGALYHVELYLVCGAIDDLRAGVYHYDAPAETLVGLREGDFRGVVAEAAGIEDGGAEAFVVMTSTFWRNAWRYEERAYRHAFWDSGTIAANLLALAGSRGLTPRLHAGFIDDTINHLLGLDSRREAATCIADLGNAPHYPEAPAVEAIASETEPLSRAEIEYPLIWRTHAATSLPHVPALHRWLEAEHPEPVPDLQGIGGAAIEAAIQRRGSARHFKDEPISRPQLAALLEDASRPIAADFPALTQAFVIVNNVEGLTAGIYHSDTEAQRLFRLKHGDFRAAAGHAALDQPAAAEAAINVYFLARLDELLATHDERGYRAAQLEAGIRGGRLYLKATELGLRVSGLTFYDDEAAHLFGEPDDTALLFLAVIGH